MNIVGTSIFSILILTTYPVVAATSSLGQRANHWIKPSYDKGTQDTLSVRGQVIEALPAVTGLHARSEITFEFQNTGSKNATRIRLDRSAYPADFRENYNSCKEGSILKAQDTCRVKGLLVPNYTGDKTVALTLSYNGGTRVPLVTKTVVGLSLLVAVGVDGIATSQDGKKWKWPRIPGSLGIVMDVAWSDTLRQFVAVGSKGILWESSDGQSWNKLSSGTTTTLTRIIWNTDLKQYLAIGAGGLALSSNDGKQWIASFTNTTADLNDVVWSKKDRLYVAVGSDGVILTSPNSLNWIAQTSGVKTHLEGIAWNALQKQYVVSTQSDYVLTSPNALHWTQVVVKPGDWRGITWGNLFMNTYVMVGTENKVAVSRDGKTWSVGGASPLVINPTLYRINWNESLKLFTAVGTEGDIFTSPNGTSWSLAETDCWQDCNDFRGIGSGVVVLLQNTSRKSLSSASKNPSLKPYDSLKKAANQKTI